MFDSLISLLNLRGHDAVLLGLRVSVEVALLAAALLVVDRLLRDRVRAALRYGLWMLVVVKLLLPPGLMSPTSIAYWLAPRFSQRVAPVPTPQWKVYVSDPTVESPRVSPSTSLAPRPSLSWPAGLLVLWLGGTSVLAIWMLRGQRQVTGRVRAAHRAPVRLETLLQSAADELGLRPVPELRLSPAAPSPAVCGLWRPVILLPARLELSPLAWRGIFLHELIHLRRRDLWANFLQVVAQLVWWWNPLVWWVNARIRHLRELAVDEAVMLATHPDGNEYPATLVAMARHGLARPALSLNFLGILESPSRLELRVRRLLEQPLPRTAQLGWAGWVILFTIASAAVPMGYREPDRPAGTSETANQTAAKKQGEPTNTSPELESTRPDVDLQAHTAADAPTLLTRQYRLDAASMLAVLGGTPVAPTADGEDAVQLQLRRFLAASGFEFQPAVPGQPFDQNLPAAYFNRTNGVLLVRNSREQLDRIDGVLGRLNIPGVQLLVTAHFVEGDVGAIASLKLPWADSGTTNARVARLTDAEGAALIARIKGTGGIDVLAAPKVTTLSGRRAQISVTEDRTIVTGQSNTTSGAVFLTVALPVGPTLDLTAWSDPKRTNVISIAASGRVVDFLGYEAAKTPTPSIRTNEARGEARLWDGQMLVLQMAPITNTVRTVDRVPVLSDIPFVGRVFRHEATGTVVRQRLMLICPQLIDPAGNRLNDPKRLPFDQTTPP